MGGYTKSIGLSGNTCHSHGMLQCSAGDGGAGLSRAKRGGSSPRAALSQAGMEQAGTWPAGQGLAWPQKPGPRGSPWMHLPLHWAGFPQLWSDGDGSGSHLCSAAPPPCSTPVGSPPSWVLGQGHTVLSQRPLSSVGVQFGFSGCSTKAQRGAWKVWEGSAGDVSVLASSTSAPGDVPGARAAAPVCRLGTGIPRSSSR